MSTCPTIDAHSAGFIMGKWINWTTLESPSVFYPVKYMIGKPQLDLVNGGPVPSQRVKVPILLFTLDCGHLAPALENTAETELRCIYHNEPRTITGIHPHEWHAKCHHVGSASCRYSRWTGTSKANAGMMADKHARTHPSHAAFVGIEYVARPEAVSALAKRTANETLGTQH